MAFRTGQEVECIHGTDWWYQGPERHGEPPAPGPKKGDVLRIAAVHRIRGEVYLQFAEWPYGGYEATSFRALTRTDISIFLAMLTKPPKKARKRSEVPA